MEEEEEEMAHTSPKYDGSLSTKQRKLLDLMLKEKSRSRDRDAHEGGKRKPSIPGRQPSDKLILSFAQQRLWFIEQLKPGTAAYNIPSGVRLIGPLNTRLFEQSLVATVRRHETLRTTFALVEGQPVQVIADEPKAVLPVVDLRGLPAAQRAEQAQRVVDLRARWPFDLAAAPPWRVLLVRIADREHVFLAVKHHIISDTWTTGVFFREMVGHYKALVEGGAAQVPELPLQYADYALWQRRVLEGGRLEAQVAYWVKQFAGAPPLLDLPLDRPRPPVQSFCGSRVTMVLPNTLTDRLKARSGEREATLFMTLMAAYQTLLFRYSGETDILVGTPMANRDRVELENLIGLFVNTLVLRTDFSGNPTFQKLLDQVRETTLEGISNHDVPFEKVVEELNLERDTSRNPLFQVLFAFQNVPIPKLVAEGLTLERYEFRESTARLDLELDLQEMPYGFVGWLGYTTDLFDRTTAERMAIHFRVLLEAIAEHPQRRIPELPLLTAPERHQVLTGANDTEAEYARERTIHQLFEARAERTPEGLAIECGPPGAPEHRLSYAELNARANQLAHHLRSLGVGEGSLVAIYLERGVHSVVALLGILKAGGAYVPLSSSLPRGRIAGILESSGIRFLVTQSSRYAAIRELTSVVGDVVCVDEVDGGGGAPRVWCGRDLAARPTANPALPADPEALAYVIFTSGSTGAPKGVMVRHRPVINLIEWVNRTFGVGPGDRILFITSLSFDLSVYDVFGILAAGGTIRVATNAQVRDPEALVRILESEPITYWDSAPAALQQLVAFFPERAIAHSPLRLVFLSGDWIPLALPDQVRAVFPQARVISLGGATEATVWSNYFPVGEVPGWWASIPYGRPIRNACYYVLDPLLRPQPIGVEGDLFIGGECLSSGYLGSPQLTAGKYLPDPFSHRPGAHLYRTGDRARFWSDGNLEFLGRRDHQVKIRGYRIELGEIGSVLAQHPQVHDAVVLVREDTPGDRRLVAYVVPESDQAPAASVLRAHLREQLPDYMVPAVYLFLDAFPVTANGKLDRGALPAPESERPELEAEFVDPRGETESLIAELWKKALRVERVGKNDNFFELGGHSLLLAEIHRELRDRLAPELTLVDLFTYPTVGSLAEFLSRARDQRSAARVSLERARARRALAGAQRETDIAVIGMALRFPRAVTPDEFWENLKNGVECIDFLSREEVIAAGVAPEVVDDPNYVRAEGSLAHVDQFDYAFFGYKNPSEVELLDPQQRIFMECAWEALERAGYDPALCGEHTGIFGGVNISSYLFSNLYDYDPMNVMSTFLTRIGLLVGNQTDYLCTRVAYHFNLQGPAITVQTACSTATVATHLACQSLIRQECDLCLAGGVQIRVPEKMGYMYQEGGFPSPDGHCRSFDAQARGNVHGNGAGVVLLKRLSDALRDGDHIHAVIKGSAASNDGSVKVGFTAPGVNGQVRAATEAMAVAGVEPETIGYVEATGTATELGDPIEIEAITRAFRLSTDKKGFCPIGSAKSNVGHTDAASGAVALIKTVLCLEQEQIPPTVHFEEPNPRIDFANSPFFVNAELLEWPRNERPRRAGVHTYAVGGTNTHLILEEAPVVESSPESRPWQLLPLSARSSAALHRATANLRDSLRRHPELELADVAYTLKVGRRAFPVRQTVLCRDRAEALELLESLDPERVASAFEPREEATAAFFFPQPAVLAPGSSEELYRSEPTFRDAIDRCAELLQPHLGCDLRTVLYPAAGAEAENAGALAEPRVVQPAVFAIEYGLAALWREWGVVPKAMLGHGVGEVVAACLAEVLSLEDALRLAVARGRALQSLPPGSRLEVALPPAELEAYLGEELAVEAVIAEDVCYVIGPEEAAEALQDRLNEEGIDCLFLGRGTALPAPEHPALEAYATALAELSFKAPQLPWLASATGSRVDAGEAADRDFWLRQLLATARLADGRRELVRDPQRVLVEVGPADSPSDDAPELLRSLGKVWLQGVAIDWVGFHRHERRLRVPLPTYPFERVRIWAQPKIDQQEVFGGRPSATQKLEMDQWFYTPVWKRSGQPAEAGWAEALAARKGRWLVFCDEGGWGGEVVRHLREVGCAVTAVRAGEEFANDAHGEYTIDPERSEDYRALLADLGGAGTPPGWVVDLRGLDANDPEAIEPPPGFWSLTLLAQALGNSGVTEPLQLEVVTHQVQEVTGDEALHPSRAMILAPAKVIPQEYPHITCRSIDVELPDDGSRQGADLVGQLLTELARPPSDPVVALRGRHRWVEAFERVRLEAADGIPARLRPAGVYLITGGAEGFGLLVAEYLARTAAARLVFAGESGLPECELWDDWLARHEPENEISQKIARVRELEALGAEVMVCNAELDRSDQVAAVLSRVRDRFGAIHGVIHTPGDMAPELTRGISAIDRDFVGERLKSRLGGLRVLEEALRDHPPDFYLLASTVAAVLGGVGVVADCAADIFLDLYARRQDPLGSARWTSVDWDAFRVGTEDAATLARLPQAAIDAAEAGAVFQRLLCAGDLPQVVVSTVDLEARLELWRRRRRAGPETAAAAPQPRPDLPTPYVAPRNELEQQVTEIWSQLLGVREIGIGDNYFDLGGNSLIATQLISRLRDAFQVDLALRSFFEEATVAHVAESIEMARWTTEVRKQEAELVVAGVESEEEEWRI